MADLRPLAIGLAWLFGGLGGVFLGTLLLTADRTLPLAALTGGGLLVIHLLTTQVPVTAFAVAGTLLAGVVVTVQAVMGGRRSPAAVAGPRRAPLLRPMMWVAQLVTPVLTAVLQQWLSMGFLVYGGGLVFGALLVVGLAAG